MIKETITTKRIKSIRDIYDVSKEYLGQEVGVKKTDSVDANNRVVYNLIVGYKNNTTYDPAININQIFKGNKKINNYLIGKYGENWTQKIKKDDIEKLINVGISLGLDMSRVSVELNNIKPRKADIRVINVTPNMKASDLIKNHLKGIKDSLSKKETIIDKDISTMESKTSVADVDPDDIAEMIESGEEIKLDENEDDSIDSMGGEMEDNDEESEDDEMENTSEDDSVDEDSDIDDLSNVENEDILEEDDFSNDEEPSKESSEESSELETTLNQIVDSLSNIDKRMEAIEIRQDAGEQEKTDVGKTGGRGTTRRKGNRKSK